MDFLRGFSSTFETRIYYQVKLNKYYFEKSIRLTASKLRTPVTAIPKIDSRFVVDPSESALLEFVICGVPIIGLEWISVL
jgi:hypothetical protein